MTAIRAYIQRRSDETNAPFLGVILISLLAFVILVYSQQKVAAFGLAGFIVFICTVGLKIETIPALLVLYMTLTEQPYGIAKEEFFIVHYSVYLLPILLLLSGILIFANHIFNLQRGIDQYSWYKSDAIDQLQLTFGIYLLILIFRGLANDQNPIWIRVETVSIMPIFGYFVWRRVLNSEINIHRWFIFLAIVELLAGFEYILFVRDQIANIVSMLAARMVTRQVVYALIGIPVLYYFLFRTNGIWKKTFIGLGLILAFIHVFVAQSRFIWILTAWSSGLYVSAYVFRKGFTRKAIRIWLIAFISLIMFMVVLLLLISNFFGLDLTALFSRWTDIGSLQDYSTLMRYFDIQRAFEEFAFSPIFGHGLGKGLLGVPTARIFYYIDNSYSVMLVKGGIVLLGLYLAIYLIAIWKAAYVFVKAKNERTKLMAVTAAIVLSTFLLDGLSTSILVYYRFTFLAMFMAAVAVNLYHRLKVEGETATKE
ncbi:hypothetical protein K8I28_06815 [bacterium]|nr:hypothetical protein [bacterium]